VVHLERNFEDDDYCLVGSGCLTLDTGEVVQQFAYNEQNCEEVRLRSLKGLEEHLHSRLVDPVISYLCGHCRTPHTY
jgi:hypothetical protein